MTLTLQYTYYRLHSNFQPNRSPLTSMCVCVCVCTHMCVCTHIHVCVCVCDCKCLSGPSGLLVGDSVATSPPQSVALVEDMALRGFAPLVRSQESLTFSTTTPSKLKQVTTIHVIETNCKLIFFNRVLEQALRITL